MTPKEMKKQNLRKQKEFIDSLIDRFSKRADGEAAVPYIGELYPEVKERFEQEGWYVYKANETLKGMPIYIFSCANETLTPEELEEAWAYKEPEDEESDQEELPDLLKVLLNMAKPD